MLDSIAYPLRRVLFSRGRIMELAVLVAAGLLPAASSAFLIDGTKWLGGEAKFYV